MFFHTIKYIFCNFKNVNTWWLLAWNLHIYGQLEFKFKKNHFECNGIALLSNSLKLFAIILQGGKCEC